MGASEEPRPGEEGLRPVEQRICNEIAKAIYEQKLLPGTKLGEAALAAVFSVSRARIRRILLALHHQRLVDLIANRGAYVIQPSEDDARDVFNARRCLENLVVEHLATKSNPEIITRLRDHVLSEAKARDEGQRREAIRISGDFHSTLARLSGSRVYQSILEPVLSQSSLIVSMFGGGLTSSCSVEEHLGIVDALERGDVLEVRELMEEHLTHLEGTLRLNVVRDGKLDFSDIFAPEFDR